MKVSRGIFRASSDNKKLEFFKLGICIEITSAQLVQLTVRFPNVPGQPNKLLSIINVVSNKKSARK